MSMSLCVEVAIQQLYARYADAVWRKDVAAFADCFTENSEWRIAGSVLYGRDQISRKIKEIFPLYGQIFLSFQTPILKVEGSNASGRVYVTERSAFINGDSYAPIGIYYDRFTYTEGGWRFSWRLFDTCYSGPPDLLGDFFTNVDYGAPPAMPELDEIPYDRVGIFTKTD